MANLGNLWFSIGLKDQTDADWEKIVKRVEQRGAKLGLQVDAQKLQSEINAAIANKKYTIDLSVAVKDNQVEAAIRNAYNRINGANATAADVRQSRIDSNYMRADAYSKAQAQLERSRKALAELREARLKDAEAARQQRAANDELSRTMVKTNSIASQLRNGILNVYSIYTVQNFLRSVIEIGGEFEKQRLALGSILQDAGHATELFSQIKSLAVVSPFGIRELTGFSKQLAAFNIPYNELYETTKRLADISAGVGVDMGRIILAYGQVRSAEFLKGTELRQFTEAGIPLVQALADRFTELEGRVVSVGEVFDMISKRKVSFDDVKAVLWEMTDERGLFNQMQEVLSESLAGKWINLKDAYDIMLADIAESNNKIAKGTIEGLTALMNNWESLVPILISAVSVLGLYKAAMMGNNIVHGQENLNLTRNALLLKQKQADTLRVAQAYRTLTAAEQGLLATSNRLTTAEYTQLATSGQLTKEYALRLIALGRLKAGQAGHIAQLLQISRAEMAAATNASRMRVMMAGLAVSARGLGVALKSLFFNPFTLIFAGLSAVMELFNSWEQKVDEMEQNIKDLSQKATEGYKSIHEQLKGFEGIDLGSVRGDNLISSIEQITETLKNYSPRYNDILKEADAVSDLTGRYKVLLDGLRETEEAYKTLETIKDVSEAANEATDGWFDESLRENAQDYSEALQAANKQLRETNKYAGSIGEAIERVAAKDAGFAQLVNGKSFNEQVKAIMQSTDAAYKLYTEIDPSWKMRGVPVDAVYALNRYYSELEKVKLAYKDVEADAKIFSDNMRQNLTGEGWDFFSLTKAQEDALRMAVQDFAGKIPGITEEARKKIEDEILTVRFQLTPVLENYDQSPILGTYAQLLKDVSEEGLFKDRELESVHDAAAAYELVSKRLKEAEEALAYLQRVNRESMTSDQQNVLDAQLKAAEAEVKAYKAAKEAAFLPENEKTGTGSGKDLVAEMWEKRLKLMKEAEAEYQKWSELVGKDKAEEKLRESGLFADFGEDFDFTNAREEIRKFVDEIAKRASTDKQKDVVRQALEIVFGFRYDEHKAELDKALKEVERQIEETTRRWDIYRKLFDATGNKEYSLGVAFTDVLVWDEAANVMRNELEKRMNREGIRAKINFTESEEKAKRIFGGENSELYKLWSETKKRIEQNGIDLKLNAANAIRDTMGIADKIRAKETQKEDALRNLIPGTSEYEAVAKKFDNEILELKASLLELDPSFRKIFQDTTGMSIRQIEKLREQAQEILDLVAKSGSPVLDENGQVKGYTYTDANGNEAYIDKDRYEDIQKRVERLGKKASEVRIAFERMWEWINGKDQGDGTKLTFRDIARDLQLIVQEAGNAADALGGLFSSLGNDSVADGFSFAGDLLNSVGSIAGGIASGNPFAVISGIAQGLTSVFQYHDKKLQRQIEESERTVQRLQGVYDTVERALERHLGDGHAIKLTDAENDKKSLRDIEGYIDRLKSKGSLNFLDLASLQAYSKEAEKLQKRVEAYEEGGAYGYNRQLLEEQYAELEKQRRAEMDKKDADDSKILDYDQQLAELRDQITYYAQDLAEELYGIDLKEWASQLGDALYEAWQQGEDGAEAFRKKAGEIIGDVMNEILKLQILEPAMQDISEYLFGTDEERAANGGKGGVFGTDLELDDEEAKGLADKFADMADVSDAYTEAMDKLEPYLNALGMSMKDAEESTGGMSTGIKSITEEQADLLSSYVNAIRADVSVDRSLFEKFVGTDFPKMSVIAQVQLKQLEAIAKNTGSNADSAAEILNILRQNVNGTKKFYV